jgi:hypothetical protein
MIACGVGMLWSAGAYVQARSHVRMYMRFKLRHAGRWRWWHSLMLPVVYPRAELVVAYVLGVGAIVAGVVVLL